MLRVPTQCQQELLKWLRCWREVFGVTGALCGEDVIAEISYLSSCFSEKWQNRELTCW